MRWLIVIAVVVPAPVALACGCAPVPYAFQNHPTTPLTVFQDLGGIALLGWTLYLIARRRPRR